MLFPTVPPPSRCAYILACTLDNEPPPPPPIIPADVIWGKIWKRREMGKKKEKKRKDILGKNEIWNDKLMQKEEVKAKRMHEE
jgi:hypothetical protein